MGEGPLQNAIVLACGDFKALSPPAPTVAALVIANIISGPTFRIQLQCQIPQLYVSMMLGSI